MFGRNIYIYKGLRLKFESMFMPSTNFESFRSRTPTVLPHGPHMVTDFHDNVIDMVCITITKEISIVPIPVMFYQRISNFLETLIVLE